MFASLSLTIPLLVSMLSILLLLAIDSLLD